ncbi:hypothetical protein WA556_005881 [Blastocystis sp. ATCC 50177/Nand II]
MEKSANQKFSKEQMELFRQVFNYLDKSKRGIVYPEYFGELLRVSGFNPTEAEIADLKSKYGNQRGITFDDYITLISGLDCIVTEADIRKAFKVFDKYNDGKIKVDLLRSVLSKVGEPLSEKEFESFIQMMNLKDKDFVDYNDLCKVLASYDM